MSDIRLIYYVQDESGPIKIGVTSTSAETRMKLLQVANPRQLTLIGSYATDMPYEDEREMHRLLSKWRIRGEWFEPSAAVMKLINRYNDGAA